VPGSVPRKTIFTLSEELASTKIRSSASLTDAIIPWLAIDARFRPSCDDCRKDLYALSEVVCCEPEASASRMLGFEKKTNAFLVRRSRARRL